MVTRLPCWVVPIVVVSRSGLSPFASLGFEEFGVPCVAVPPPQIGVEPAGQHDMVGMVRVVQHELSQRPEMRLDRVRPRRIRRGETQLDPVSLVRLHALGSCVSRSSDPPRGIVEKNPTRSPTQVRCLEIEDNDLLCEMMRGFGEGLMSAGADAMFGSSHESVVSPAARIPAPHGTPKPGM